MQSHIWDCTVATIVKQKLFFIHLRLFLFYLSLSSLHFFLLSFSLCFANECALPMIVLYRWSWVVGCGLMCSGDFVGLGLWVWVCGSGFIGLHSVEQVLRGWRLQLQAPRVSKRRLVSFAKVHLNLPPNHGPKRHFFVKMGLLR